MVVAFRKKMASEEVQERCVVVDGSWSFVTPGSRASWGYEQFHVRGLAKVQMEMLWACLTYNLQHSIRFRKAQRHTSRHLTEKENSEKNSDHLSK